MEVVKGVQSQSMRIVYAANSVQSSSLDHKLTDGGKVTASALGRL